ncbi:MAG: DUF4491 family protein [Alistipes putredinis]|nr:MAG: DUF4491 family protein [Alistipes putredinis]
MEFIEAHNLTGLIIGAATFLVIGLFHPLVIKGEYYFGVQCWWVFMLAGAGFMCGALLLEKRTSLVDLRRDGILVSVVHRRAFSLNGAVWKKGWFPSNPKKKTKCDK